MNLLDVSLVQKENLVIKHIRIFESQNVSISIILSEEKARNKLISEADIIRSLIDRSLKVYAHKKGTFYCQRCKNPRKNKERHVVPVGEEEFVFGDCCFFNDSYKDTVRQML